MSNNKKFSELSEWENEFYMAYNDACRCYLHNQSPICFMNVFLEKITKITGSIAGYITSLYNVDTDIFPNIEAVYKDRTCDDFSIYNNNWKISLDKDSICYKAIVAENIQTIDDISTINMIYEPIKLPSGYNSYICVPYKFNGKTIGVLGLFRTNKFSPDTFYSLNVLGNLIASLQNNYFKIKLTAKDNDRRLITYQLLEDILNTVHDALIIVNELFEIIHTNAYTVQLISELYPEFDITKLNGITLLELFPDLSNQTKEIGVIKKVYKNKKIDVVIENNTTKKILEIVINTVICGGEFYHLTTIHCKKREQKQFQGLNEKKLIAFLSHELRNPLQSVTLANHLLKTGIKVNNLQNILSQKMMSYFDIINKSCEDMKKIINDILDLSRLESNDFVIELEICNVEELIESVLEEYLEQASLKKITLQKNITNNVPISIYTDITRSRQILSNLISNAIKYSSGGVVMLEVSFSKDGFYTGNHIKFSVIDKGEGIKDTELDKLFKTYGQTSSGKGNMNSQGLGLCVSQKIANLLGGKITVKSEISKGSTFSFYHPIKLELSGNKYENNINIGELSGSVLLVDDNSSNLILLHTLLEQFTYEYTWAVKIESVDSGEKAVQMCGYNNYDIIFMDINMPGISGCTASKIIKSNGFKGKIVATTGNILSNGENRKIENDDNYNNFDEIILKPFDDQTVLKTLRKFLISNNSNTNIVQEVFQQESLNDTNNKINTGINNCLDYLEK